MDLYMDPNMCPFCGKEAQRSKRKNDDIQIVCKQCGRFKLTEEFVYCTSIGNECIKRVSGDKPDPEDISVPIYELQAIIYEKNSAEIEPYIGWANDDRWTTLKQLVSSTNIPITPFEKMDRLIENLAKECQYNAGQVVSLEMKGDKKLAYAKTSEEFSFLLTNANELGLLEVYTRSVNNFTAKIGLKGWKRIDELKTINSTSKQGFMAHWFELEDIYIAAIQDGILNAGYTPLTLKGANFQETILSKALGEINRSRFVVVDLTEQRPTVFVEAGYALGRGLQTILVVNYDYWNTHKNDFEFYMKNFNIKAYSTPEELKEIVERAILERIL